MRELTRSRFRQIVTRTVACSPAGLEPQQRHRRRQPRTGEARWHRSLAESSNAVCDVMIVHTAGGRTSAVIR